MSLRLGFGSCDLFSSPGNFLKINRASEPSGTWWRDRGVREEAGQLKQGQGDEYDEAQLFCILSKLQTWFPAKHHRETEQVADND